MLFLESSARAWLIVHAIVGAATVAVATHLVVWIARGRRARWFATVGLALYAAQFALGNLIYPVYRIRVRAEYLENATAVRADVALRREAAAGRSTPAITAAPPERMAKAGRLFDVKEHWAALGLALAAAACALAWAWEPKRDGRLGGRLLVACAVGAAACAWLGGVVGLYVTSLRAVGSP